MSNVIAVPPNAAISAYRRMVSDPWNAPGCGLPDDHVAPSHTTTLSTRVSISSGTGQEGFVIRLVPQPNVALAWMFHDGTNTTGSQQTQNWDEVASGPAYSGKIYKYRVLFSALRARYIGTEDSIQGAFTASVEPYMSTYQATTAISTWTTFSADTKVHGPISRAMPTITTKPHETIYVVDTTQYDSPGLQYIFTGLPSTAGSVEVEARIFMEMIPEENVYFPLSKTHANGSHTKVDGKNLRPHHGVNKQWASNHPDIVRSWGKAKKPSGKTRKLTAYSRPSSFSRGRFGNMNRRKVYRKPFGIRSFNSSYIRRKPRLYM